MEGMGVISIGVVGGGLVGLATALRLTESVPGAALVVWEKESGLGRHQSTHNSGVLHAGLYYRPGSLKARLAVEGVRLMTAFAERHGIRHERCGKLVVATNHAEIPRLRTLLERGTANGLTGLEWLEADAMREVEPHVAGVAAVRVPEEGIIDYAGVVAAMAGELRARGVQIYTGANVRRLQRSTSAWRVHTSDQVHEVSCIVNCAGLYSDEIARAAGEHPYVRIIPFRGEYYQLRSDRTHLVRHLIYPVPDPAYPFLGVHFTRMINGGVEAGPNAVLALAREGYGWRDVNLRELIGALGFPGLWRFMARHPAMTMSEVRRSLSKRLFTSALQRLVPEVMESDLIPGGAGVRAQAMSSDGKLVQDFSIIEQRAAVHVLNAPSPGATASLAIGGHIAQLVTRQLVA
jgi:(S)-2-hydroxyglutarate dehydrogenase